MIERLIAYGDQIQTDFRIDAEQFVAWTETHFKYVPYNPKKSVNRFGLSITSLDGELSGVPDLDSLFEYNAIHNTSYDEMSFNRDTKVFEHEGLQALVAPWKNQVYRSHVLKLGPGGFFPPHRDGKSIHFKICRLIVPLVNCNPPDVVFMVDDRVLYWSPGSLYFLNTFKTHTIFNA